MGFRSIGPLPRRTWPVLSPRGMSSRTQRVGMNMPSSGLTSYLTGEENDVGAVLGD